jgi:SurA N-terminal domain/PPIC-type PPIASE domain
MLDSIRKRQRTLLTLITIIVIVAFAWIYNPATMRRGEGPGGAIGKLNGRTIIVADIQKIERNIQLASAFGMQDMIRDLTTAGRTRDDQFLSFAWNTLLLRDVAKSLEIEPASEQIARAEKALPQFQTNNQFDPAKYQQVLDTILKPNGFSAADLDDVVADYLRYTDVADLVKGSSPLPEAMFKEQYDLANQKLALAIVRFNRADFESAIQVTDDDIQKYYNQRKGTLLSPERRTVEMVSFELTEDQKKLPNNQKVAVMKPLAQQADSFAQAVLQNPGNFDQIAKEKGLNVVRTDSFTFDKPDKTIAGDAALVRQVFNLSKENPVSDVIEGPDGFSVMKLVDIDASRPLTLAEAKDQIITAIKEQKAQAAIQAKANELRGKVDADMKKGVGFVQAAESAGAKVETPEPFALADPGKSADIAQLIAANGANPEPNETLKLLEDKGGAMLVHVLKIEPVDQQKYEEYKKTEFAAQNAGYERIAVREWLRVELQKAGRPPIFGQGAS